MPAVEIYEARTRGEIYMYSREKQREMESDSHQERDEGVRSDTHAAQQRLLSPQMKCVCRH